MRKVSHDVVRTRVARHRDDGRHRVELADQRRRRDACKFDTPFPSAWRSSCSVEYTRQGSWHGPREELAVKVGHHNVLSPKRKKPAQCQLKHAPFQRIARTKDTYHKHKIILLRIHLVDRANAIDSDIDLAPKLFQKLGTQFPTDSIVLDKQHARRDGPSRHGRLATTD